MADSSHRPGPFKQDNKTHKTGRHRSKGAIENARKGKVEMVKAVIRETRLQRKDQRRNHMNQLRKQKRSETMNLKRRLGRQNGAPFLVCVVPMHSQIDANSAMAIIESCDPELVVDKSLAGVTYINLPLFKQRFAFIVPPVGRGNELTVLDYMKVCNTTLLVTSAAMGEDEVFDRWGVNLFNMMTAQGIPSPTVALMDLESLNPKRRGNAKSAVQKYIGKLLPNEKIMQLDTRVEALNLMRRICEQKNNVVWNKDNRPHMFGDVVEFVPNANPGDDFGTLKVTGFLRGIPLDVNGLVHIPGLGDFQMSVIESPRDPYRLDKSRDVDMLDPMVAKAIPALQTSLNRENIPDAMDAEQTWPTEEEIKESQKENKKMIKRIPKGYSDYQAAWIPEIEAVEENGAGEKADSDMSDDESEDDEYMSCENKSDEEREDDGDADCDEYLDTASVSEADVNDEKYDLQMDLQEERDTMKKIKDARSDQMWPDEIDTPLDVPARERFQKFRGLESFRTSPWDPKENLPSDYARIYKFRNFDRTKKRVIKEAKDIKGVEPGSYITVHIVNVPETKWNAFKSAQQTNHIIVYGLLPHEHQMSVMNVVLQRMPDSTIPIKSKEKLIIQCGYRRFIANPIFSQHTSGDKHKFERYFRPHTIVCATFFAPIQFSPAPVLAFKENPDTTLALVARGTLLSCNPDRIILKRLVLSGHPMRINRKSATIRYMFFNKEDVDFFKPVKLRTKCGRLGHIKESLGTHGHMKCYFDGQLRSYDTVFMYLFKRVFPKWTYEDCVVQCEGDHGEHDMPIE